MTKAKKQLLALVDRDLALAFQAKLITEELSYRKWLEREMRRFLKKNPPRPKLGGKNE